MLTDEQMEWNERQTRQIVELLAALVKHLGADVGRRGY